MKYRFIITSICVVCFFSFHIASSQTTDQTAPAFNPFDLIDSNTGLPVGFEEQLSIEQIPKIPRPDEFVSIRLESYMTDLNKAQITWIQDGTISLSGTGAIAHVVQAPQSGKTSIVSIRIVKENGGILNKQITLSPADVDLIYEAQTYAHPFFKGKKLFTSESNVTFIAIPNFVINGKVAPLENLVYTWEINGTVQQNVSGFAQNTFSIKGSLIERPTTIGVTVSAINSPLIANKSITLKSTNPEILLYENNPVLGVIYEKALQGTLLLERAQIDFEAIPYFFSAITKNDQSLTYRWFINKKLVESKTPQENYILLQNNNNEEGTAGISVTVKHNQNILQNTGSQFNLNFKKIKQATNEIFNF